ncbi:MAG: DUF255 domain-containing protein [Planctomycetota bacterium]
MSHQFAIILACLLLVSGCIAAQEKPSQDSVEKKSGEQEHKYTNALIDSTSPYLLQHSHNPVNWMPWGPEAFAKAKRENKPIFVSIGYSTCYWCHVMERQSFEDEEVAEILNAKYVCIKVDREERPDIDEQLMLATQLFTGRGGWPNSVWLTVDGRPWMAGTYFPKEQFMDALEQLATAWTKQAEDIEKQANSFAEAIRRASALDQPEEPPTLDIRPLQRSILEMQRIYDEQHAGFGSKPKFPPHGMLRLLFAGSDMHESTESMLTTTLDAMFCGGMHDHVGGGFHRYSTDEKWFLPHFEKMLYDNAQLMRAYSEAYAQNEEERFALAIADIFGWLTREMTHPKGGFYSAIDSESEDGEEGRYYTWSMQELEMELGEEKASQFAEAYNFEPAGNFTEEATGERPGTNIPFLAIDSLASTLSDTALSESRAKLREARKQREYPHLDDKILTAWNGLMISALAHAGRTLDEKQYTQAAEKSAGFILSSLMREKDLLRSWRADKAILPGYLNDYAFFIEGLMELHKSTNDPRWLNAAQELADRMLDLFEDKQNGGFYFTGEQHEELLVRSKNLLGGGNLPNGNGVAAICLLELYRLTDQAKYFEAAEKTLTSFSELMLTSPRQVEHLVLANTLYLEINDNAEASPEPNVVAKHQGVALSAQLIIKDNSVKSGETIDAELAIQLKPNFHIYTPDQNAKLDFSTIPVSLQSKSKELVLEKVAFPKGKSKDDKALNSTVNVYSDTVNIPLRLKFPLSPAEETTFELELSYQACDDKRCLEPQSVSLKFPMLIK